MRVSAFGGGLEAVREDAPVRLHPHRLAGPKLEAQKVEADVGEVALPVHILAVDDLRLLRMQHQLAGRKAVGNRTPECPRLLGALAVTDESSSGEGSHLSALTEPDGTLSRHPAPTLRPPVVHRVPTRQTAWGPVARCIPASALMRVPGV